MKWHRADRRVPLKTRDFHFEPPRLHCRHTRSSSAPFWVTKAPDFDINADAKPAFHCNADPDPTCQIMRIYADPQPFWNLIWTNGTKLRQDIPLSTAACAMSVPSWRKRKVLCTPSVFTAGNRTGLFFEGQESKESKTIPRSKKSIKSS